LKKDWGLLLIPPVARMVMRSIWWTLRVRHVFAERIESLNREGKTYVLALWHGHLFLMVHALFTKPITAMISQHRDGELIARTLRPFGVEASRGSSTRGAIGALRDIVRISEKGMNIAFTPDGPRGPRHVAQSGVVMAAQLTGKPIMPVVMIAKKKRV